MKIYCVQGGDVAQEGGDAAQEGGDAHNGGDLELKKKMANKMPKDNNLGLLQNRGKKYRVPAQTEPAKK